MVRREIRTRGRSWTQTQKPEPNLPKTQCASEMMDEEEEERTLFLQLQSEAEEVKVAPLRLRWSLVADINTYVLLTFSSFYCGCRIFPDGRRRPLSVTQNPEEISK